MSAEDEIRREMVKVEAMTRDVFLDFVSEAERSIVNGSEITGAPGQPVDTGYLKSSWQTTFEAPMQATIGTNTEYAEPIEDGVGAHGPLTLRSQVGGFHSVKMTVAAAERIRDVVVRRIGEAGK